MIRHTVRPSVFGGAIREDLEFDFALSASGVTNGRDHTNLGP